MFAFKVTLEILLKSHWSLFLHINLPQWDCSFEPIVIRLFWPTCYKFLSGCTWVVHELFKCRKPLHSGHACRTGLMFSQFSLFAHIPFLKFPLHEYYLTLHRCCFKWISKPIFLSLCAYHSKTHILFCTGLKSLCLSRFWLLLYSFQSTGPMQR